MAQPTQKSSSIEGLLQRLGGGVDRRQTIAEDICHPVMGCGQPATEFRNEISRKEFTISGLCQKCQDSIFDLREEE